ncbi:hypothetical protein Cgig2_004212 [Carnegiea gigantea]|uniref:Uncharacterized protein n=1 Tax=Carnegiea gigantea TaxID=171969 RepID=A0A9Q1JNV9_9CARY|nr:hypothetical protein Cgig2_004212 [Carnegiea gigantea]
MTDTIAQRGTEQAKKTTKSIKPLSTFDYMPIARCEPSHRHAPTKCPKCHPGLTGPPDCPKQAHKLHDHVHIKRNLFPVHGLVRAVGADLKASGRSLSKEAHFRAPFSSKPQSMTTTSKPYNAWKYYELYKQNTYTTAECRELKKAFHELINKGYINHFLKRSPRSLRKDCDLARKEPPEEEFSTEIVATITVGYAEGITQQENRITIPVITFDGCEGLYFSSPHNDPLVIELNVVNTLVPQILTNTGSFINVITCDCLKRFKHPRREIIHLIHPILGFGGQEVNPIGVIRLPLQFRDKSKA